MAYATTGQFARSGWWRSLLPAASPSCSARGGAMARAAIGLPRAPGADPRRAGRGREPPTRRADARGRTRDQPGDGHRCLQPAARAGLHREPAGLGELGDAARRPPIGARRDRRRSRSRHADRRAAGAGGARGAVPGGGSRASAVARPPRLRPARAAAAPAGDRGLVRSSRAAHVPEQILVTNGAMHGSTCRSGRCSRAARRVLVELPSYPVALDALRGAGARLSPVPVTREGWDLDALANGGAEAPARARVPDAGLP